MGPMVAVGLGEGLAHDGIRQVGQHVHVLRALAGKQEGDLAGCSAAEVNALGLQNAPLARVVLVQGLDGLSRTS